MNVSHPLIHYKYFSSEALAKLESRERLTPEQEGDLLEDHNRLTSKIMLQPLPNMSRNATRSKILVVVLGVFVRSSSPPK
jgi:hypothetical protein